MRHRRHTVADVLSHEGLTHTRLSERPWYREPETFIALAALVVSISAVAIGLYEASLQRQHDRAEVYPRLSIATVTSTGGATISVINGGIGPAIVSSITVSVDGKPRRDWADVLTALLGRDPGPLSNMTIADEAIRAGDRAQMVGMPPAAMPADFWNAIGRVSIAICYQSLYDEAWTLEVKRLGKDPDVRTPVKSCAPQPHDAAF